MSNWSGEPQLGWRVWSGFDSDGRLRSAFQGATCAKRSMAFDWRTGVVGACSDRNCADPACALYFCDSLASAQRLVRMWGTEDPPVFTRVRALDYVFEDRCTWVFEDLSADDRQLLERIR